MADNFASYDQEWSLQAIVKGCVNGYSNLTVMNNHDPQMCSLSSGATMPQNDHQDHLLFAFSDHLLDQNSKGFDDGLEAFYKPFYPVSDSCNVSKQLKDEADQLQVGEKQQTGEEIEDKQTCLDQSSNTNLATAYVPKYKRRKNQHKRVVMQVTAEGLSSDKWAWRKYGQKPIKGSPYPRSYYRCSSMKGCLARKQVEQSCSDPSMFIVTYTAEHCHSQPTRRNSLAGTIRNKLPSNVQKIKESSTSSPSSSEAISSKSSLMASTEEELSETKVKQENIDEDEAQTVQWGCNNEFSISDILMDDDFFFAGFENLDGSISDFSHRP